MVLSLANIRGVPTFLFMATITGSSSIFTNIFFSFRIKRFITADFTGQSARCTDVESDHRAHKCVPQKAGTA